MEEGMVVLDRQWNDGDSLELHLPMKVKLNRWVENSVSVERGPLVYVLKIGEEWTDVSNSDRWGDYSEIRPTDPWNYGLVESAILDPGSGFEFVLRNNHSRQGSDESSLSASYPWNLDNAPVAILTHGKIIPDWNIYREMAGALPHSLPLKHLENTLPDEIVLIPYGCSKLRITEFPVVR